MRCIDCKYFWRNHYDGMSWCEAWKKSKRIQPNEEYEDLPCNKGKIREFRFEDSNRNTERI